MFRLRTILALVGCMLGLMLPVAGVGAAKMEQGGIPTGWKRQVWQGVSFQYDPQAYRFEITKPSTAGARAGARLVGTATCPPDVADCFGGMVNLEVFTHRGGNARAWMATNGPRSFPGFAENFTDTILGSRQAIQYVIDIGVGGALTSYAVPTGVDMLVLTTQVADPRILASFAFTEPDTTKLAVGQVAMTKLNRSWDLWNAPSGGVRVDERPKLIGGTFLTILALRPQATQVRTSDGVTGWIRAAATTALVTKPALIAEDTSFVANGAKVVATNGLVLRSAPRSTATKVVTVPKDVAKLPNGQRVIVLGRRGDWLRVLVNDLEVNGFGWLRWNYDGARYMMVAPQ